MNRRKGTPCGCDSDPCGCSPKSQCIKTINGQYPDANHEFGINAGEGVSIDPDGNGIRIGIRLASPMVFRGTVGTGGTIATLPTANAYNLGWTYVAISSGTTPDTPPKSYDIGDMLISNSVEWSVVPSGDDPVDWSQIQNKPTTVAGYGITDAVDTSNAQTVGGAKTFLNNLAINKTTPALITTSSASLSSSNGSAGRMSGSDSVRTRGIVDIYRRGASARTELNIIAYNESGADATMQVMKTDNGDGYVTAPVRTYNASNTNDVVTIGSLQASSDVVHRTGNETIDNTKTFLGVLTRKANYDGNGDLRLININDNNNVEQGYLYLKKLSDGKRCLYIGLKNSDNSTYTYIELARSS